MSRRRVFLAGCMIAVMVAAVIYFGRSDSPPESPIASIRFRNALCRTSDDWCFVTLYEGTPTGQIWAGAVLRQVGQHFEYRATIQDDGAVAVSFGPRGTGVMTKLTYRGIGTVADEQRYIPIGGPPILEKRAAQFSDVLLRALNP